MPHQLQGVQRQWETQRRRPLAFGLAMTSEMHQTWGLTWEILNKRW